MDLQRVVIRSDFSAYLDGHEVEATVLSDGGDIRPGMRVMGFHDSIAVKNSFSVPKQKQSQYIGVEGTVTEIEGTGDDGHLKVRVKKV